MNSLDRSSGKKLLRIPVRETTMSIISNATMNTILHLKDTDQRGFAWYQVLVSNRHCSAARCQVPGKNLDSIWSIKRFIKWLFYIKPYHGNNRRWMLKPETWNLDCEKCSFFTPIREEPKTLARNRIWGPLPDRNNGVHHCTGTRYLSFLPELIWS